MHAVVVKVAISQPDPTRLREVVVRVKQMPGFVAGYWTREGSEGLSMVVFDSEEHARAASDQVPSQLPVAVGVRPLEPRRRCNSRGGYGRGDLGGDPARPPASRIEEGFAPVHRS
jgi:hypothetical protein